MKVAVVDLETYWAVGHSLTKMSPIAYCTHPETEIISCAFKFGTGKTVVVFGEQKVKDYCADVDWSQYWVIGHNLSGFDAMILSWRLGIKPRLWGCTLAMARPLHSKDVGLSLAKLVAHYELGFKDQSALIATKGKHLCDFTDQEIAEMSVYNAADVDQCYDLYTRLIKHTPSAEVLLIDMTIRMLIEPVFDINMPLLINTLADESERKQAMLAHAATVMGIREDAVTDEEAAGKALTLLSSMAKFAEFLRTQGVDVPTKVSERTGKDIPALAKTDEEFIEMQNHPNPLVATVASARLDAKSTILQTRIQAFMDAANAHPSSKVPIPLKYYGADTTGRWSGWGYNPQNLPRINPYNPRPSDAVRKSLRAPAGYKVVVADLSGIELRVNHFLWQVNSSMVMYNAEPEKADLYKDFASKLFEIPQDEVSKEQRQLGKVAHLGLGFGAGASAFVRVAKTMGGIDLDVERSQDIVNSWREEYSDITAGWRKCDQSLPTIMNGYEGAELDPWGMITPMPEGLKTPKGFIRYPDMRKEYHDERERYETVYGTGRNRATIYGGKMNENIVQHLARCVIADNAIDVQRHLGLNPALMVHDELVYVVPHERAQATLDDVQGIMRTPPSWWPELITWSEGDIADTYGDAK
jgi:DNA polymerase I-like protein with 3'-5' exonuclease and polymerase domains